MVFIVFPITIAYIFNFIYVPLYVLQGITSIVFYYIGYIAKENDLLNKKCPQYVMLIMIIVWIYCILFSHIDMQSGYYDNIIVNVIGAISGTYFVYLFSKIIEKRLHLIKEILKYCGKCSLVILCFHSLDYSITAEINPYLLIINKIQSIFLITDRHYYRYYISLRFIYIIFVLLLIPRIYIIKRLFSIK